MLVLGVYIGYCLPEVWVVVVRVDQQLGGNVRHGLSLRRTETSSQPRLQQIVQNATNQY